MSWENILKIKVRSSNPEGTITGEKDMEPEDIVDYLTYRNWAWQSAKVRRAFNLDLEGEEYGRDDDTHIGLLGGSTYRPKHPEKWIKMWNVEFGPKVNVYYEV